MNKPAQFTPGPWRVDYNRCLIHGPTELVARLAYTQQGTVQNGNLIAAAPEMYQSGTLTVDIMERVAKELERKGLEELRSLLRSAIIEQKQALAQAEGRQA